jgi:hypothetical protein
VYPRLKERLDTISNIARVAVAYVGINPSVLLIEVAN